jgi:hypothetical protein
MLIYYYVSVYKSIKHTHHSDRTAWGMKCLRPLKYWDHVFKSNSRHACLSAFILLVLFCVGSDLVTVWSPIQGVLPTLYEIKKFKGAARTETGL